MITLTCGANEQDTVAVRMVKGFQGIDPEQPALAFTHPSSVFLLPVRLHVDRV